MSLRCSRIFKVLNCSIFSFDAGEPREGPGLGGGGAGRAAPPGFGAPFCPGGLPEAAGLAAGGVATLAGERFPNIYPYPF